MGWWRKMAQRHDMTVVSENFEESLPNAVKSLVSGQLVEIMRGDSMHIASIESSNEDVRLRAVPSTRAYFTFAFPPAVEVMRRRVLQVGSP